jgi:hypothetical protein
VWQEDTRTRATIVLKDKTKAENQHVLDLAVYNDGLEGLNGRFVNNGRIPADDRRVAPGQRDPMCWHRDGAYGAA